MPVPDLLQRLSTGTPFLTERESEEINVATQLYVAAGALPAEVEARMRLLWAEKGF